MSDTIPWATLRSSKSFSDASVASLRIADSRRLMEDGARLADSRTLRYCRTIARLTRPGFGRVPSEEILQCFLFSASAFNNGDGRRQADHHPGGEDEIIEEWSNEPMVPTVCPTPILERQQPLAQPRRRNRVIPWLIGGAIGLVVDLFGLPYLESPQRVLVWTLAFVAALFVGMLIHELGHLAAGKLAGFEFHRILAGPWMVSKESRGLKLRFFPRGILMFAGHTVMIPRNTEKLRRGFALFAAGGPVVTALLFLPLIFLPWSLATTSALVANLMLAVFSWIPMTIVGSPTDGKILRMLAGTGPSADRFAAILYLALAH